MRRVQAALLLILLACGLSGISAARAQCPLNYATVTGTHLGALIPLSSGILTVTAVDNAQRAVNYSVPISGAGLTSSVRVPVVNGALTQQLCLPRSDQSSIFITYHFVLRDTSSTGGYAIVLDAQNVPLTSPTFSLDTYPYPDPNAQQLIYPSSIAGTSVPPSTAPNQVLLTTSAGVATWANVPDCPPDGSHALTYSALSHTFSCANNGIVSSGPATIANTFFLDQVTGTIYLLTLSNGQLALAPAPNGAVGSNYKLFADASNNGNVFELSVASGVLTVAYPIFYSPPGSGMASLPAIDSVTGITRQVSINLGQLLVT